MPVTVYERHISGDFTITRDTAEIPREFFATGSTDQGEIELAVKLTAGVVFYGLVRIRIDAKYQGGLHWFVTVAYANVPLNQAAGLEPSEAPDGDPNKVGTPGPTEGLDSSFAFDFSGQTVKIFQSRKTIEQRTSGANGGAAGPPDNERVIGATDKGVEGCEIYTGSGSFSRTVHRTSVTPEYLLTIFTLTGCVNFGHKFFGLHEGEILYLGASGQQVQFNKWDITHKFAFNLNELELVVAADGDGNPLIKFPEKKGWDYLDVEYEEKTVNNKVRRVPVKARVERVYREGNLKLLGCGG